MLIHFFRKFIKNANVILKSKKIFFYLTILNALFILIAVTAPYIPAYSWVLPSFFNLVFIISILPFIFFTVFWAIAKSRNAIFCFFVLLISLPAIKNHFGLNGFNDENIISKKSYAITTFNTKVFDLYNWKNNEFSKNKSIEAICINPSDIICLQEFYTSNEKGFNNLDTLIKKLGYDYHLQITKKLNDNYWGIITLSKFPIINKGVIEFEKYANNTAIYTDLILNMDTLRVFNCHLQSAHFNTQDYQTIEELKKDILSENVNYSENILGIYDRLSTSFKKRSYQAEMIEQIINTTNYKTIVCGDFNDIPNSYVYKTIKTDKLQDAFLQTGIGLGNTYKFILPLMRIDHILLDTGFVTIKNSKNKDLPSDHFLLKSIFSFK